LGNDSSRSTFEIKPAIKGILRGLLPATVVNKVRFVRDQIAIRTFESRIVNHVYGGISLRVKIADTMSAQWYDRDFDELPEFTFLKQRRLEPGALIFDLGAHQAVIALLLARIVGESGRVIAVEAGKYNFDIAVENRSLNLVSNLSLIRAAVAEKDGVPMTVTGGINGSVSATGEPVVSKSIDALASEFGKPDVVWLDIEGYECKALEGAQETLKDGADWHVEVHSGCGLESFGGSAVKIEQIFREHGYDLYFRTDQHYQDQFRPMSSVPKGHFYMICCKDRSPKPPEGGRR
jgi:FkbM family methyltransferase